MKMLMMMMTDADKDVDDDTDYYDEEYDIDHGDNDDW
jgi:hypothetical protein